MDQPKLQKENSTSLIFCYDQLLPFLRERVQLLLSRGTYSKRKLSLRSRRLAALRLQALARRLSGRGPLRRLGGSLIVHFSRNYVLAQKTLRQAIRDLDVVSLNRDQKCPQGRLSVKLEWT